MNRINQILFFLLFLAVQPVSSAPVVLKFATLAPEGSAWMLKFDEMKKEILEATGGQIQLKAYPAGVLGEEKDVLFKIKVGQVDGGGFMSHGIGKACPDVRAMMLPMTFDSFEEVDAVFAKMKDYFEAQCRENGFVAVGWTEIGFSYLYSTKPVRSMADLRGAKPWSIPGEELLTALFEAGKVSTIPVPVSDVLTALQTGLIQTIFSPPLAAVAMQWFSRVTYRNDLKLAYAFGGLFVSTKSWEKVPAELQPKILEISQRRMNELTAEVRKSNEEALQVMAKNGIEVVASTPEDIAEYKVVSAQALESLKDRVFSAKAWNLVQQHLAEFRAGKK